MALYNKVPFTQVKIEDQFWAPKIRAHKEVTIPTCFEKLRANNRIDHFDQAIALMQGKDPGEYISDSVFEDSDVYKVLEGVGYALMSDRDPELEAYADSIIDKIAAAQWEDGYISTPFTVKYPGMRWTDMLCHECYCIGHMLEAAVAYYLATGKEKFLNVAKKVSDHMYNEFIVKDRHWICGHQEVELGLVKLYKVTNEKKYLELAQYFIEQRGHNYEFREDVHVWTISQFGGMGYCQNDKPVRELEHISGHAVRAMYYYSAIVDVADEIGDQGYIDAMDRVWESTMRNMYITGGIGSSLDNEGFTEDFDLPNATSYCETCASIGMVYWASRMNRMKGDAFYADIMEKAMYNGSISGINLVGNKFFYDNPLESDGSRNRSEWFGVSCCPTQLTRFLPSIGDYAYAVSNERVLVNLYLQSTANFEVAGKDVVIRQTTNYPWEGCVKFTLEKAPAAGVEIGMRYPSWCRGVRVSVNGKELSALRVEKGYIIVGSEFKDGDEIVLEMTMPVERVKADDRVKEDLGKVALQRGPLVYCVEEIDNRTADGISCDVDRNEDAEDLFIRTLAEEIGSIDRKHDRFKRKGKGREDAVNYGNSHAERRVCNDTEQEHHGGTCQGADACGDAQAEFVINHTR